nr:hypothetical protein [Tanacetum cinerariifolium]
MGFKGIARVDRGCVLGCDFILDSKEGGEEGEQCRTTVHRYMVTNIIKGTKSKQNQTKPSTKRKAQKNTLAEYMILFGADNRPTMLDKDLYNSWKSQIELYMQNREHERMILESVEHGPLIWPMVEENVVIKTYKYAELSTAEKIQADCNMKATNIILQGDDLIACLNKAMVFLTAVASSRFPFTNNQLRTSSNPRNQATIQDGKEKPMLVEAQEAGQISDKEQLVFHADLGIPAGQAQTIIPHNVAFHTKDLDTYDSDCDDLLNAQAVLMANISNYGSDVISETTVQDTGVQAQQDLMILSVMEQMSEQMINHKAQRIKPILYDEIVISEKHVATPVIDDEETLILEEESQSMMPKKAKDPEVIVKKISHKPIDYEKLNRLTDDFGKRFTPQQELSTKQAFWLRISNPTIKSSLAHVRVEVPSELPKKRTTTNALTEG